MMPNHAELIDKLEKATEGSRELSARVFCAAMGFTDMEFDPDTKCFTYVRPGGSRVHAAFADNWQYATSLDAIVALIERKLPGWCWEVTTHTTIVGGIRKPSALLVPPDLDDGGEITDWGDASTPALALCIALLRAIQHQGGGNG